MKAKRKKRNAYKIKKFLLIFNDADGDEVLIELSGKKILQLEYTKDLILKSFYLTAKGKL